MNMNKQRTRFALLLFALAAGMLLCAAARTAAQGPVGYFPDFIQLALNPAVGDKTGDVAVDKIGNVYVLVKSGPNVQIWKFSPAGEGPVVFAVLGTGVAYGLAVDANGDLYATKGGSPADRGVYQVERDGTVMKLPGTEQIVWPNALAFDQRGNLYVTESYSAPPPALSPGGIWRIPPGGAAELWLRHPLLDGNGRVQGPGGPVGANGISYYLGDLYVANTDQGSIVRIPVLPNGSPGEPEVWATLKEVPESPLAGYPNGVGGDGLALDVHGNVYVAVVTRLAVVRINAGDLSQETLGVYTFLPNVPFFAKLDTPNSLAFGTGKGGRQHLFVTNLGRMALLAPGLSWPGPGLLKIWAGVAGLPLP